MKKITCPLAALALAILAPVYAKPVPAATPETPAINDKAILATVNKKAITQGDILGYWKRVIDELGSKLTPDQEKTYFQKMQPIILTQLIEQSAKEATAMNSGIAKDKTVQESIEQARKNIIVSAFMRKEKEAELSKISPKDLQDAKEKVLAEKGDQITISYMEVNSDVAPRITQKIAGIGATEGKISEWTKLAKEHGKNKQSQEQTLLLSELPEGLQEKLGTLKTGSVLSVPVPETEKTRMIMIMSREKISGELLMSKASSFLSEQAEQRVMDRVLKNVKIQRFDQNGKPEKTAPVQPQISKAGEQAPPPAP